MDNRLKDFTENFENNPLGLDDTFQFNCRMCGKCCKNRHDIMLTTRDLYNIAKYFGRSMRYVVERYCVVYTGEISRVPIVRLQPSGPEQACPLLRDKRCVVHASKPVVCALFPLGRGIFTPSDEDGSELPDEFKPIYVAQPVTCGKQDQIHTVRDWLGQFGIPVEDEFYILWTKAVTTLSDIFRRMEEMKITDKPEGFLRNVAYSALYINYQTDIDLMPQFRDSMADLRKIFAKAKADIEKFIGGAQDGE